MPRKLSQLLPQTTWIWVTSLLVLFWSQSQGQTERIVSGTVSDESKLPLPGATVKVLDTKTATVTDQNGNFNLKLSSTSGTLIFSYTGMITKRVKFDGQNHIDVTLEADSKTLEAVVVVGYGSVKKSDITGSVASVKADQLTQLSSSSPLVGLQGKAAGVNVVNTSGEPGSPLAIRIRGVGTINNSNPVYVVDGYITSNIDYLTASDIERIEVLKDASATAIYGSRGANGVIVVSTKKGKSGPVKLEVESYAGVQRMSGIIPMADATEFATLYKEAIANGNGFLNAQESAILNYVEQNKFKGTDWQREVLQPAPIQNYQITMNGGKDGNSYFVTGGYFNQQGLVKNSGFKRYNVRFNTLNNLTDRIKFTSDIAFANSFKNNTNSTNILLNAMRMDPITAAWDNNVNFYGSKFIESTGGLSNPALHADRQSVTGLNYTNRIVGNFSLEFKDLFINGLDFVTRTSGDLNLNHGKGYTGTYFLNATDQVLESSLYDNQSRNTNMMASGYLTYKKSIGVNDFSIMGGSEYQTFKNDFLGGTAFDIADDPSLYYINLSRRPTGDQASGDASEYRLLSYFTRANYSYKDKYFLTGTFRADGSSKFKSGNQWGFFPSFSLAWDAKKESFLSGIEFINSLKLRGGWGKVGNEGSLTTAYGYANLIDSRNYAYSFGGAMVNGSYPRTISNSSIQWESTNSSNIGLDLRVLSKLSFTADAFTRKTVDMILVPTIPAYVGADATFANIGSVENKGLELSLDWNDKKGDFSYGIGVNTTFVKNNVTSIGTASAIISGGLFWSDPISYTEVGKEIGYFKGFKTDGIFNNQQELDAYKNGQGLPIQPRASLGDVKFVDLNSDGKIDNADKTFLGSAFPTFTSGINLNFGYKNFYLTTYAFISKGNKIANGAYPLIYGSDAKDNFSKEQMNRWTPQNPNSNIPRVTSADPNRNSTATSDLYVEDGSFVKIKNIQLGYLLPQRIAKQLRFSSFRIFASVDNLHTFTKYRGWDPEAARYGSSAGGDISAGVDSWNYPMSRNITGGVKISF
ncbi:MAG: TonB-dependent receptor [Sphingobacteriaceae bacterium]|nr:TonB-dependent receptor [Sphingobacteriaceae bacterium]